MSVQEIKRAAPPLTDIAGRLRLLAEKIESGALKPDLVLCVLRFQDRSAPSALSTFAYGNYLNQFECDGIMLAAASGRAS